MRAFAQVTALAMLAALATACSSPASHLYTLTPTAATATTSSNLVVLVGPVSIPAIVDRPQIVVTTGPNQVSQDEFHRWAAPLQSNMVEVVSKDLMALLGTARVLGLQDGMPVKSDYRVVIAIQAFDSAPGEAATLDAVWTVRRNRDDAVRTGSTDVREPATQQGFDALAAAHSRALARVSQDIADAIRALENAPAS